MRLALILVLALSACGKKGEEKPAAPSASANAPASPPEKGDDDKKVPAPSASAPPKKDAPAPGSGCEPPENLKADYTITHGCKVEVAGDIRVNGGVTLTIQPGAKLSFKTGRMIYVDEGALIAKGTAGEPIIFTSAAKSPAAGDWQGIVLTAKVMAGNVLDHARIEYAGRKNTYAAGGLTVTGGAAEKRITITSSTFEHNDQCGVTNRHERASFAKLEGNTFKENGGCSLDLDAMVLGSVGANKMSEPVRVRGDLNAPASWPHLDVPVVVTENLTIRGKTDAAILKLADKTTLKIAVAKYVMVGGGNGGGIVAKDCHFLSSNGTPEPGDWQGIIFDAKATGTTLEGCTIEHAGREGGYGRGAITFGAGTTAKAATSVKLKRLTFKHNKLAAIHSSDGDCGEHAQPASGNKSEGAPLCAKKK
jgi:predicted small lipoprotein YifL